MTHNKVTASIDIQKATVSKTAVLVATLLKHWSVRICGLSDDGSKEFCCKVLLK
jgi:hypothetical protein